MHDHINSGISNALTKNELAVATVIFLPKACGLIG